MTLRVAIVGAGAAGLAAAYDLTRAGAHVVVYEAASQTGGLASGFRAEGWSWSLERFYHHWFASDTQILRLIRELGLSHRVRFPRPVTAIWYNERPYPFDSPLTVLRFPGLSMVEKLRMGLVIAYLRLIPHWKPLERVTAHEWLPRYMGQRAYEQIWQPLLEGKFGEAYREINMAWFWARIHKRSPRLGTFEGGFQAFFDLLAEQIRRQGGEIRLMTPVIRLEPVEGGWRVEAADGSALYDAVMVTTSPRLLVRLAPALPASYVSQLLALRSLGAVVLILALDRPLTRGIYWINLPKRAGFPFLALVEHTNYIPPEHYGEEHLVYCGDYLPADHPYFSMSPEELLRTFLPALPRFNPSFQREWIRRYWVFREPYAQPVVPVNYSRMIPDLRTPLAGLYFASMSQVYPWDRGTNYAVELGRHTARLILADGAQGRLGSGAPITLVQSKAFII
ncbi:MAG: NAD(P)/FAD-dependent oxidoreductase [Anaerolineae bacterium]|nr:NAD(P)/FAD-dependent oxidoreductase [Thermoflexus sp.]MDW8064634.1 NAD(P)/FAD-dependent oxidoreductase [Anaerolineae bacterium]